MCGVWSACVHHVHCDAGSRSKRKRDPRTHTQINKYIPALTEMWVYSSGNNNKTDAETKNAEAIIRSWSKNGQMRASERGMHQNRSRTNLTDRSEATSQRHVLSSSSSECVYVCARSDLFSRSIHTQKRDTNLIRIGAKFLHTHSYVCWLAEDASVMAYFALEMWCCQSAVHHNCTVRAGFNDFPMRWRNNGSISSGNGLAWRDDRFIIVLWLYYQK